MSDWWHRALLAAAVGAAVVSASEGLVAQPKTPSFPRGPSVRSPEVLPDGRVLFRLLAPEADDVGLQSSDMFGTQPGGLRLVRADDGVWQATVGPLDPGAYRYTFTVQGVSVVDPRNTSVSESNSNVRSVVYVPGAAFMEAADVAHGAVAEVWYPSRSLGRLRRMHVYTPPGYEAGTAAYPVFYLLHGAMDCDDSWTTVGRAGFILDNLIAAGKARPMIVVMPAGHTSGDDPLGGVASGVADAFAQDFVNDIAPCVERAYRVLEGRQNRAIAGLSMGGIQTLGIAMSNLGGYAYIGVFSSGVVFGGTGSKNPAAKGGPASAGASPGWEQQHRAALGNADLKKGLKLLWFATGSEDFLIETTRSTVAMLQRHGFSPVYRETGGGHTWANWREYLHEFAPQLFR